MAQGSIVDPDVGDVRMMVLRQIESSAADLDGPRACEHARIEVNRGSGQAEEIGHSTGGGSEGSAMPPPYMAGALPSARVFPCSDVIAKRSLPEQRDEIARGASPNITVRLMVDTSAQNIAARIRAHRVGMRIDRVHGEDGWGAVSLVAACVALGIAYTVYNDGDGVAN